MSSFCLLWAAIVLVGFALVDLASGRAVGFFWMIAGPLGGMLVLTALAVLLAVTEHIPRDETGRVILLIVAFGWWSAGVQRKKASGDGRIRAGFRGLNKLLGHRARLGICVLLARNDQLSFSRLKEILEETDGNLGAQLRKLEDEGFVTVREEFQNRHPVHPEDPMTADTTGQRIVAGAFRDDDDFRRVRDLLIKTYPITPTGFNWEIRRWDGWRFYRADPTWDPRWSKLVHLWETEDGELVGAVHPEGTGDAHLELHPDYRQIEEDMIAWAEEHLAKPPAGGRQRELHIFAFEYDAARRCLLEQRGYERTSSGGVTRRLRLGNKPLPQPVMADGYRLRTTRPGDDDDCQRVADILNAGFNRDFHTAGEFRVFSTHASSFRHDLDLVAVAPDGSFAAYVGVPYDDVNRCGIFEPVCTHPEHRRKGLARSLMFEGLRRLKSLGAADVCVGTGDMEAANRLYESIGFSEAYKEYAWRRSFQ